MAMVAMSRMEYAYSALLWIVAWLHRNSCAWNNLIPLQLSGRRVKMRKGARTKKRLSL